jgi:hypothetical protein
VSAITTQQRPHPRHQFREGERLDEVVIGAVVEARDAVVERVPSGEHQHSRLRIGVGPHTTTHLATVDTRHRDVEAQQVVGVDRGLVEGVGSIVRDIHGVALASQTARHRVGQFDLVVDHQDSHPPTVPSSSSRRRARVGPGSERAALYGGLRSFVVNSRP